jgi:NAD(P)-dependent dehydrogenase (short-subunit alcohol dehydrogenase family)
MQGKICLVTGATGGIGRETARGLAARGATVIVVGRDRARGEAAVESIRSDTGSSSVELMLADLSSQAAIRQLAAAVLGRHPRLDVLVNNAGALFPRRGFTVDGIERTFALNHLGYFLLTTLLLDRLRKSAPARIVNVASAAHRWGRMRLDDLQAERRYVAFLAYSNSKLANLLFTYELARRLEGSGVTANAVHPGTVASEFGTVGGWFGLAFGAVKPFLLSPTEAAATSIYLASSPEVAGTNGKYFIKCRERRSSGASQDHEAAARLWQASEALTRAAAATGAPAPSA